MFENWKFQIENYFLYILATSLINAPIEKTNDIPTQRSRSQGSLSYLRSSHFPRNVANITGTAIQIERRENKERASAYHTSGFSLSFSLFSSIFLKKNKQNRREGLVCVSIYPLIFYTNAYICQYPMFPRGSSSKALELEPLPFDTKSQTKSAHSE